MSRREAPPSPVRLEAAGDDVWRVVGRLDFSNAGPMLEEGLRQFGTHPAVTVDLSGVEGADSAGMALLLEWAFLVERRGGQLRLEHVPDQLRAIAGLSGLDEVFMESHAASSHAP